MHQNLTGIQLTQKYFYSIGPRITEEEDDDGLPYFIHKY